MTVRWKVGGPRRQSTWTHSSVTGMSAGNVHVCGESVSTAPHHAMLVVRKNSCVWVTESNYKQGLVDRPALSWHALRLHVTDAIGADFPFHLAHLRLHS